MNKKSNHEEESKRYEEKKRLHEKEDIKIEDLEEKYGKN